MERDCGDGGDAVRGLRDRSRGPERDGPARLRPAFEQFQADVNICRDWAAKQVKGAFMDAPSFEVQRRYDNAYVQCMYAKGHQVPGRDLPARTPAPPAGSPPPPPPQTPPK